MSIFDAFRRRKAQADPAAPDVEQFKRLLREAVATHIKKLTQYLDGDRYDGYSLYTSDDVPNIGPVASRVSARKRGPDDPQYTYYRYSADEWSEWDDFGLFGQVDALIGSWSGSPHYIDRDAPRLLRACSDVLWELKLAGAFSEGSKDLFLVVWVSDSESPEIWNSAKRLNSADAYAAFISEFTPPDR